MADDDRRTLSQARFLEQAQELFDTNAMVRQFAQPRASSNPLFDILSETPEHKALPYRLLDWIGEGGSELLEGLGAPGQVVRGMFPWTGPIRGPRITGEDVTGLHPGPFQPDFSPLITALLNPKATANLLTEVVTDPISFLPLGMAKRGTQTMGDVLKPRVALPSPEAFPLSAQDKAAQLARTAEPQDLLAGGPKPTITPGPMGPERQLAAPLEQPTIAGLLEQKPGTDFAVTPGGRAIPSGGPVDEAALLERIRPGGVTRPERLGLPEPTDFLVTPGGGITGSRSAAEQAALMERVTGKPVMDLTKAAEVRSFDLAKQPDGSYRLVGPGGREAVAANEAELSSFLVEQPIRPPQPIELKTPVARASIAETLSGEQAATQSTFEKAMRGEALGEADEANLEAQRAFWQNTDPIRTQMDTSARPATTIGEVLEGKATPKIGTELEWDALPPIGGAAPQKWDLPSQQELLDMVDPIHVKMVVPNITPAGSNSRLIQQYGFEVSRAQSALDQQMKGAGKWYQEHLAQLGAAKSDLDDKASRFVEGLMREAEAGPKAVQAGLAYRTLMKDFAKRMDLPEWDFYATRTSDWDAIYGAYREKFVSSQRLGDLDDGTKGSSWLMSKIGTSTEFQRMKGVFEKYPSWEATPKAEQRYLQPFMHAKDSIKAWKDMPTYLRTKLPKELFDPFLLKREGSGAYKHSLIESFNAYVPVSLKKIQLDPLYQRWKQVVDALPGQEIPITEKGYLRWALERQLLERPTWDEKLLGTMASAIDRLLGDKGLISLATAQVGATLTRSAMYRYLLGPDSAVQNLTGHLNTWMETGRWAGPMGRFVQNLKPIRAQHGVFADYHGQLREWDPLMGKQSHVTEKILQVNDFLDRIVLAPHALTEFTNKGVAAQAGIEEALAKGYTLDKILLNAFAKQSEILPNPAVPNAWIEAWFKTVPKTQFGGPFSAQRSPYLTGPLGRLSTTLATWPVNQTNFYARGFVEAVRDSDKAKLARFTAGMGAFFSIPYLAAEVFGVDIRRSFGPDSIWGQLTFPFFRTVINGIQAVRGDTPLSRQKAQEEFGRFIKGLAIPQFRYLEKSGVAQRVGISDKLNNVLDNINRGYGVDTYGRYLYETTALGELMKLIGVSPEESYDARQLTKAITDERMEMNMDRRQAITDLLTRQDPAAAQAYSQKWGRAITMQDLLKAKKDAMKTPQQRALERVPKTLRGRVLQDAQDEAGVKSYESGTP